MSHMGKKQTDGKVLFLPNVHMLQGGVTHKKAELTLRIKTGLRISLILN